MKKIMIIMLAMFAMASCTDDFQELNKDPNVAEPPSEFILNYVLKNLGTYKGEEWYHENHQTMTWAQYLVQGQSNVGNIDQFLSSPKYGTLHGTVINHLNEFRRQVSLMPDEDQELRKKMVAVSHVIQAYFALKVTDQYGSMPYTEAGLGRSEGKVDPKYDTQEEILNTLLDELDGAISVLGQSQTEEFDFSGDFIYDGNWDSWIKCANAVKLRIATRFESQNVAKTKAIIAEVGTNIFSSTDEQFVYDISQTQEWRGTTGADFEWKGTMWSPRPIVDFMKSSVDPRLRIFYQLNGYNQATLDDIAGKSETVPEMVDVAGDNQVLYTAANGEDIMGYRYIGVPTHRQDPDVDKFNYADNPSNIGSNANMVSKYHKRLLQNCNQAYGGGRIDGKYVDVLISYSEECFLMAEFILKGYATGDAEEWYNKGVRASIDTYNKLGVDQNLVTITGGTTYNYVPVTETEITNYLATTEVAFDGVNNLEKVYVQTFLDFYRLPEEGWALSKRTGYPKFGSSVMARTPVDNSELKFPRRIPTPEPGDLNRANWEKANGDQGFAGLQDTNPAVLNSERLWWDKNNPAIGSGGN